VSFIFPFYLGPFLSEINTVQSSVSFSSPLKRAFSPASLD
jgi:hypothetical protein